MRWTTEKKKEKKKKKMKKYRKQKIGYFKTELFLKEIHGKWRHLPPLQFLLNFHNQEEKDLYI